MVRSHPLGRAARPVPAGERRVARYACPAAEVEPLCQFIWLALRVNMNWRCSGARGTNRGSV